jgi:hypothetical protein
MSYHIFLVGQNNFKTCVERGVYGGIQTASEKLNSEILSSFWGITPGDFVFFYVKNIGVYGLWKTTTNSFYDNQDIWGDQDQLYPYRVCFEPAVRKFKRPVALSDILDLRDRGKIWTFDLGAITKKSHHPITVAEGKELIRLLLRNNPIFSEVESIFQPYVPEKKRPLPLNFDCGKNGRLRYEGYLNAWFMKALAEGKLKELIGDYRDFLNYVPTSFNKVMDLFLTHVTTIDSINILHKFSCIELKTGAILEKDLNQIVKYENWLVRKLADGDSEMVQSILVGFNFDEKVLDYRRKRRMIEEKTVRLIKYKVNPQGNDLILEEVID